MAVLPISVQNLILRGMGALDTEDFGGGPAISAVDLTRSYVYIPGHESGAMTCDGIFGAVGPNEACRRDGLFSAGFNTDGQVQQFCVEMPTPTTMRVFRQGAPVTPLPKGAPGCGSNWEKVYVVEYT
jgi:hypothetical protein